MNAWPQFTTRIDDLDIHFVHARSPEPDALPLVITHGWPGIVVEFLDVHRPADRPGRARRRRADAFHVVCPSLPGYGFSDRPVDRGPRGPVDRRRVGDAHGAARLRALRRAGRRLGLGGDDARSAQLHQDRGRRHPRQHADRAARPAHRRRDRAGTRELRRLRVAHAVGHRLPASSSRPGPRRSATGWSTRRSASSRGSSRSSGRGPTATATRYTHLHPDQLLDNVTVLLVHRRPARRRAASTGRARALRRPAIDPAAMAALIGPSPCRPAARCSRGRSADRRDAGPSSATRTSTGGTSRRRAATSPRSSSPRIFVDEVRSSFRSLR